MSSKSARSTSKSKPDPRAQIEAYLDKLDPDKRKALDHLRAVIRKAAPDAREAMVYGVPGFRQSGALVCYAAHKDHCGFYPMNPDALAMFAGELADRDTAKGTIRFTPDDPLPDDLVARIVRARIAQNESR